MLKITQHLNNANLYLIRRQVSDGKCAALLVMRTPARHYSKNYYAEDCPPVKPWSKKPLYGLIGATLLTGAAIVYAKNSNGTRTWLVQHAPWADRVVALVYQEDTTYWEFSVANFNKAKKMILDFTFGKEGISPMDFPVRPDQDLEADAKKAFAVKEYELPPKTLLPFYQEEPIIGTPEVDAPSMLVQTDKCDPPVKKSYKITKPLVELEEIMHISTKKAVDSFKSATKNCEDYNKAVFKVVEMPIESLDKKHFGAVKTFRGEREANAEKAAKDMKAATAAIASVEEAIEQGIQTPPETIAKTKRYIVTFRKDLADAEKKYLAELEKGCLSEKYWDLVQEGREAYKAELKALFPSIDLKARKLDLKGDADLLLIYTLRQVQYLQNELAEIRTVREHQINKAIDCNDEKGLIDAKISDLVKKELQEKAFENQLKILQIEADHKIKMKQELAKQLDLQQKINQGILLAKEKEIMSTMSREVSEKVEKERCVFKKELAAMVGKLQAIERTLKERAKAEAEARQSQSVWAAAEALLAATRRPGGNTHVKEEIKALEKAGKNDKLVATVLGGIPKEAIEDGIVTETSLKQNFDAMERMATQVALISKDGASLPTYFLSWLMSKVLFQKLAEIPRDELNNLPTDFSELDTFDIMQRARYYMDRGNLSSALRYVNLLQGAPRAAAQAWLCSARVHLEVRQAAETVMAHASLAGLLNC